MSDSDFPDSATEKATDNGSGAAREGASDSVAAAAPKFRRRAEQRPDEVLDAALALFTEKGYAHSTVDAIARRAGISKGAVYLYFPTKQAILEGLVTRAITPITAQAMSGLAEGQGNVRQGLETFLRMLAARLSQPEVLAVPTIVIREAVVAPDIAMMYRRAVLDHAVPATAAMIQAGVARGELRAVDPEMTVRTVIGAIVAHIFLAEIFGIVPEGGLALDRLIENHLSIIFDGLLARREEREP